MVGFGPKSAVRFWVFFLVAVLLASPGLAQEPPVFELPEVVVPGRRPQSIASTPASISVLTRADLERLGVLTVGDALQFLVEVHMRQQGGLGALSLPSIRGTSPNQVLVLIDGVPVNSVMLGLLDLSTISAAQVERIEVLRGPFSALYGSGALGGVISITTAGRGGPEVAIRAGGFSTTAAAGRWSTDGGEGLSVTVDRFSSAGARPNSDVTSLTLGARVNLPSPDRGRTVVIVNHFRSDLGVPGSTAFPSPQARQTEARTIASGRWERSDGGTAMSMLQVYGWIDDFRYVDPAFAVDSRIATQVVGGYTQRVLRPSAGHFLVVGAEWQHQALQHNGPVGSRQATVGALYLQDERQLSPRTLLAAGLRYDLHSVYGGQLNPRLGIVHQLRDDLRLRAGIGRTFRGPSFGELYFTPFNNPTLRPESAWSADAGIAWTMPRGLEIKAGLFVTEATDLIRPDAMFIPQNIGRATISGGSVEVGGRWTPRLTGSVSLTGLQAVDRSTGAQLLRVPWVSASAALHYQVAEGRTLSGLLTYVGTRPDIDPATFTQVLLPSYTVLGLRYTATSSTGQWQLGIDNLLDVPYAPIAGYPAPRRTAYLAFTQRF